MFLIIVTYKLIINWQRKYTEKIDRNFRIPRNSEYLGLKNVHFFKQTRKTKTIKASFVSAVYND